MVFRCHCLQRGDSTFKSPERKLDKINDGPRLQRMKSVISSVWWCSRYPLCHARQLAGDGWHTKYQPTKFFRWNFCFRVTNHHVIYLFIGEDNSFTCALARSRENFRIVRNGCRSLITDHTSEWTKKFSKTILAASCTYSTRAITTNNMNCQPQFLGRCRFAHSITHPKIQTLSPHEWQMQVTH